MAGHRIVSLIASATEIVAALGFEDAEERPLRDGNDDPVSALAWDQAGTRLAFGTEAGVGGVVDLPTS